jgi:hypothetical protein
LHGRRPRCFRPTRRPAGTARKDYHSHAPETDSVMLPAYRARAYLCAEQCC